jgi:hypothetical protein
MVSGLGTGIEPRVPQNLIRAGGDDTEMLAMGWGTRILARIFD